MKRCPCCNNIKTDEEFYSRGGKQKHLLDTYCIECRKSKPFREKANNRNKKYERTTRLDFYRKNPLQYLWSIAKKRAKKLNIEFSILPTDIVYTGFCPVTGDKLDINTNKINSSISLDRVDNKKGYIKGNVVAISRWANLRKSDLTLMDLNNLSKYIERYTNG